MFKKMKNKKGFTLAELLIVIAIIAVLIAIAVPVFASSMKRANQATDAANIRAAKAAAVAKYLDELYVTPAAGAAAPTYPVLYYMTKGGELQKDDPGTEAITTKTLHGTGNDENPNLSSVGVVGTFGKGEKITVKVGADGSVGLMGANPPGTTTP